MRALKPPLTKLAVMASLLAVVGISGCRLSSPVPAPTSSHPLTSPGAPTIETPLIPTSTMLESQTPVQTARPQPWMEGPISIGSSTGGRPLEVYRFGSGDSARLIVAGIHGGYEWNTTALAEAMIEHLSQYPEQIPSGVTLYILPVLNPDGAARGRDGSGRANDRNVDLNRNWPALWEPTGSPGACSFYEGLTTGEHPSSEPEVRALLAFIVENHIELIISYHSAALGIFPGGQPPDSESVRLAQAVSAVSPYPYPPVDVGCRYTGQLIDWASQQSIPSLDIELTDHSHIDWEINLEILRVFLAFE